MLVDRISLPGRTTYKSLLHCSSVGRNPIFLTCSYFCLLDASNHTCKSQTSPPYYLWWRIIASLVSNMYHSLKQHLISSVRSFWTLSYLKISTSYHGQAGSTGNKNIYPLPWSSSLYSNQKHLPLLTVKQLVPEPKTSASSHGQADSNPTGNIYLLSRSSSYYSNQKHITLVTVKHLVLQPKTPTSSHGEADRTPTKNICLFSGQGDSTPIKNIYLFSSQGDSTPTKNLPLLKSGR